MEKKRRRYGKFTTLILEKFADVLIASRWFNRPNFYAMVGEIIKAILEENKKIKKYQINKTIKELEEREVLYIEEKGDKAVAYLKDKGKERVLRYSLKKLLDYKLKKKKWEEEWFLVFFDVPETQRKKRDYLRKFLTQLGFCRYQKSVYIFPYECEGEIKLIKKIIEGTKYMKYIVAKKIEDEEKFKTFFKLRV